MCMRVPGVIAGSANGKKNLCLHDKDTNPLALLPVVCRHDVPL